MGVLNLWVAYRFSTDAWVNFKLFGGMGLMLLFTLAQGLYISRHLPQEAEPAEGAAAEDANVASPAPADPHGTGR